MNKWFRLALVSVIGIIISVLALKILVPNNGTTILNGNAMNSPYRYNNSYMMPNQFPQTMNNWMNYGANQGNGWMNYGANRMQNGMNYGANQMNGWMNYGANRMQNGMNYGMNQMNNWMNYGMGQMNNWMPMTGGGMNMSNGSGMSGGMGMM